MKTFEITLRFMVDRTFKVEAEDGESAVDKCWEAPGEFEEIETLDRGPVLVNCAEREDAPEG